MKKRTKIIIGVVICIIWGVFIYATYETFHMKYWFRDYDDWVTVHVEGCGVILIPEGWKSYMENELLYIADENDKIIFIESKLPLDEKRDVSEQNVLYEISNYEEVNYNCITSITEYGEADIVANGEKIRRKYINICTSPKQMYLILWDDELSDDVFEEIAWNIYGDYVNK